MPETALRVLLVEDNPADADLVAERLELVDRSCQLEHVTRAADAIDKLCGGTYDVALLDLSLPDGRGAIMVRRVLEAARHTAVIVLTGLDDEAFAARMVREGAQDYLAKGAYDGRTLLRAMRHAIERKRSAEQLARSEATTRALLQAIPDRMFRIRGDGTFFDALGKPIPRPDVAEPAIAAMPGVLRTREARTFEYRVARDGGLREYEARVIAIDDDEVLVIARDMTERRDLERQLAQAQKLESIGQLASGIAHEINTPLQYVGDSLHFLRSSFDAMASMNAAYREAIAELAGHPGHAAAVDRLREAEDAADLAYVADNVPDAFDRTFDGVRRVVTIVRAMKQFGHPDPRNKILADLNKAIANTLVVAQNEYRDIADIETDYGELPPVSCVLGDLNQVVLNLIVNAAHAIKEVARDGRKGRIAVRTTVQGGDAVIAVSDSGCGVPEAIRHRIFDPFFTTKPVGGGTGQGLAISRSIVVDKHGGTISCASEPGGGATFTIRIPIAGLEHAANDCETAGEHRRAGS